MGVDARDWGTQDYGGGGGGGEGDITGGGGTKKGLSKRE